MPLDLELQIQRPGFSMAVKASLTMRGIAGLFGPSGSGKTSLLRCIAGLDKHTRARVIFQGETWQEGKEFVPPYRRPVGYVFQKPSLFEHLSVRQNILYAAHRRKAAHFFRLPFFAKSDFQKIIDENTKQAIQLLRAEPFLDKFPYQLSGGEAARAAILRALARKPAILLLDEPLSALDAGYKREFLPWLTELSKSLFLPMLYVSHDLQELARISDDLVWMKNGQILNSAPTPQVLTNPSFFLEQGEDACFLLEGIAKTHNPKLNLLWIDTQMGKIVIPETGQSTQGKKFRLLVLARDVSLSLSAPRDSSIRNVLPVFLIDFYEESKGSIILRLGKTGSFAPEMLSRITKGAFRDLGLQKGNQVFAQVKGVAVLS